MLVVKRTICLLALTHLKCVNHRLIHAQSTQGSPSTRMSVENLEKFGASGDDTARYDDREEDRSVAHILERLEDRMNHLEL